MDGLITGTQDARLLQAIAEGLLWAGADRAADAVYAVLARDVLTAAVRGVIEWDEVFGS